MTKDYNIKPNLIDDEAIGFKRLDNNVIEDYQEQCVGCIAPKGTRCESATGDCIYRENK